MNRTSLVIKEIEENMKIRNREFEDGYISIIEFLENIRYYEVENDLIERIESYEGSVKCEEYYELECDNSYNYNNTLSHDINWTVFKFENRKILSIRVHTGFDIRAGYTDRIYYNFEDVMLEDTFYDLDNIEDAKFIYFLSDYYKDREITSMHFIEMQAVTLDELHLYKVLNNRSEELESFIDYEDAVEYCIKDYSTEVNVDIDDIKEKMIEYILENLDAILDYQYKLVADIDSFGDINLYEEHITNKYSFEDSIARTYTIAESCNFVYMKDYIDENCEEDVIRETIENMNFIELVKDIEDDDDFRKFCKDNYLIVNFV